MQSYLDTSSGDVVMDLGSLDDADVTVTTDYDTAKAIFVLQDAAAGMQAFMTGKIQVQGDMMKLMAMQAAMPTDEASQKIAEEIKAITECPERYGPVDCAAGCIGGRGVIRTEHRGHGARRSQHDVRRGPQDRRRRQPPHGVAGVPRRPRRPGVP